MDMNEPAKQGDDAQAGLALYKQYATSMFDDAETWLRTCEIDRAISEALPDALLVTNEAGTIVRVNHAFELMFGYPRGDVIGQPVEMLLPDDARARHIAKRAEFNDAPRVREMGDRPTLRGRRKNGDIIDVTIKLGPAVFRTGMFTIALIRRTKG